MTTAVRRVCQLRLRGASETAVRRTELALRDALRTASLHDEGGRMVLVRRLALGRIGPRARTEQVARTLEVALAEVAAEGRHGADPTSGSANMVWFRDALEAHLTLARLLLVGPPPREWYWPLVVRAWRPEMDVAVGLRALARSLAALPEAPAALPVWIAALARDGHAPILTAALQAADVRTLEAAMGWPSSSGADVERGGVPARGEAPARPTASAAAVHPSPPVHAPDDAARFVAAMLREAGEEGASREPSRVPVAAPPGPGTKAAAPVALSPMAVRAAGQASSADPDGTTPGAHPRGSPARLPRPTRPPTPAAAPDPRPDPGAPRVMEDGKATPPAAVPTEDPTPAAVPLVEPAAWPGLSVTEAGGIGFVLNVLRRLGYAEWLEHHPGWAHQAVAHQVLARVLDALAVPEDDPVRDLVRRVGRAPPRLRERAAVRAWSLAVHRWLRVHARIGMDEVVLRPGRIAVTRTHLDVWFDPALCDLRIRRAGLDLDPGWLPWLGRVVAFHYEAGEPR